MEVALKANGESGFAAETDKLTINCEASLEAIRVASGPDRPRRECPKLCNPIRADAEAVRLRCGHCSTHKDRQRHESLHDAKIRSPKKQPKKN